MILTRHLRRLGRAGMMSVAAIVLTATQLDAQVRRAPQARRTTAPVPQSQRASRVTTVEGITEYSLPNGLKVLLFPDQSKPTVTVNITYLVGSKHEGYGETGMAHLLEHLAFKGSAKHPNIAQELTDHGSRPNGTTWYDRTNYFETVPATDAHLEWALDLEADRMVNSFIAKKDLESEFSVVRNEFEMGENFPFNVTLDRVMDAAFRWHGYGRSTIGNKSDIEGVPIERLQAFYRKYYQPDNAVLVVAGKFEPAKTLALIERKFGSIPRPRRSLEAGNLLFATYTTEPVQDGERVVTVRRVGDTQLLISGFHTPSASNPDASAVNVLSSVLTDEPSGRLYKALVDTKLAASVAGWPQMFRDPALFLVWTELRMEQSLDSARVVLERTLDGMRTTTVTAEEVDRAKTNLLKNIELSLNNSETIGYALTEWAASGDWRLMFLHRDRIAKVTPADVQRVAAAYLKPSNRTLATFIPTKSPDRAVVPATPNIAALVGNYRGGAVVQAGEAFDASPRNIDNRTKRSVLPNGMSVTLLPKQTRGDRVVADIRVRYGTVATLTNKTPTAGLTAAMLSRGTTSLTRQQVKDSLDKLKAQVSIGGGGNVVSVDVETLRDNFIPVLRLVAQQLRSPRFDAEEFAKLKQEQLAGIEQSKSEPLVLGGIALQRKLTPYPKGHPLYTPMPDEQIADINAVTLDDVKAFHREFYGASHGDVSVVGDLDEAAVSQAVAQLFGDWRNPQPFSRIVRTHVPVDSSLESIETPDKANALFVAGTTFALRDDDPDYPAMVIADFMLGGGFISSRIANRLRQKEGISYGAGTQLEAYALDRVGAEVIYAIFAPQNADRVLRATREEIDRVRADGFTSQELEAAKPGYLQARSQERANDEELVGTLIERRFAGRTMAYDEDFEKKVQALTVDQVNAAVRKYIDPKKLVLVKAGDFAKNPPVKATP